MLGGSVSTTDRTCGRREAVDECGEQPERQPNRLEMAILSKRPRCRRGRGGQMGKEETGVRENQKRRKQHLARRARCLPLPNRNNNSHCNKCNSNNSGSGSSNAATVAAVYVVKLDSFVSSTGNFNINNCMVGMRSDS